MGRNFGDEYFAELDMIEVVEKNKRHDDDRCEDSDEGIDCTETRDNEKTCKAKSTITQGNKRKSLRKKVAKKSKNKMSSIGVDASRDFVSVRRYFGPDEESYIMDAKKIGNLGRYMNHSCNPNVFVQNVFVDTHDLRFPWIAFFTSTLVRSGGELCWDYGYVVGSVQDKVIHCNCGTEVCRGRLL